METATTLESAREPAATPVGSLADSSAEAVSLLRSADWAADYADDHRVWAEGRRSIAAAYAALAGLTQSEADAAWSEAGLPGLAPCVSPLHTCALPPLPVRTARQSAELHHLEFCRRMRALQPGWQPTY